MARLQAAVAILDLVKELDQQISATRRIAEQRAHLVERDGIDTAAFRRGTHAAALWPGRGTSAHSGPCYHPEESLFMQVEFFGVSRERAGTDEIIVDADSLGRLLGTLAARMPALAELIVADRLHPSLAASLNGDRFISDPETPLRDDDRVLIVSSDAGG
jgi:molybdopterin converting factor small subunit